MDQETHDAAVRTVAQAALKGGDFGLASRLESSLSPPAKPEAKLEALPSMAQWHYIGSAWSVADNSECMRLVSNFGRALRDGQVKIVDERGKGAEADKSWSPCVSCAPHYSSLRDRFRQKGESNARLDGENGALRRRIVELENDILRSRGPGAWPLNQKGAEAERLAPCPVGGPGCTPMAAKDKGKWIVGCAHGVFVGVEPIATLPFLDRLGACMAWNAAFERAERFPGER